jgi:hypothetical protein
MVAPGICLRSANLMGNGRIYQRLQPITFDVTSPDMSQAVAAYLAAMRYEFTVLQNYLYYYFKGGALIIMLGDHQPIAHITGPRTSARVPIHVISRNPALLEPFLWRGYVHGGSLPIRQRRQRACRTS